MCTGIEIRPQDGTIIFARSMEFGPHLDSHVIGIPAGRSYTGLTPTGEPGLPWTNRYPVIGANAYGSPYIVDGLNEKGLYVGLFYFPGYVQYQQPTPDEYHKTVSCLELGSYLLGTCATIEEVREAIPQICLCGVVNPEMGTIPPLHYFVGDTSGTSIVIEYTETGCHIHDNPLGVITNAPTFDWHMTNLRNYLNLSVTNVPPVDLSGVELSGFGVGTGMLGLPGDFTPPSRFVRAVAFTQSAFPVTTAAEGISQAFHLLNHFDIPWGAARSDEEQGQEKEHASRTQWTSACDLNNLRYYYHSQGCRRIHMLDLKRLNFLEQEIIDIPMATLEDIVDVTPH